MLKIQLNNKNGFNRVQKKLIQPVSVNPIGEALPEQIREELLEFVKLNQGQKGFIYVGEQKRMQLVAEFHPLHVHQVEVGWIKAAELYDVFVDRLDAADQSKIKNWIKKQSNKKL